MFDEAMDRLAARFGRVEPRRTARAFVLGLLSGVDGKAVASPANAIVPAIPSLSLLMRRRPPSALAAPLPARAQLNATPVWAPDGRAIAYTSWRSGFMDIYISNIFQGTLITRR